MLRRVALLGLWLWLSTLATLAALWQDTHQVKPDATLELVPYFLAAAALIGVLVAVGVVRRSD